MKIIKHNGNGQTYCVGCLAAGRQPIQWDCFITEVQYDGGKTLGCFCLECYAKVSKYLGLSKECESE